MCFLFRLVRISNLSYVSHLLVSLPLSFLMPLLFYFLFRLVCIKYLPCPHVSVWSASQAYFMLDELLIGGEIQETSKRSVLKTIMQQDLLQEETEASRAMLDELMI